MCHSHTVYYGYLGGLMCFLNIAGQKIKFCVLRGHLDAINAKNG